MKTRLLELVEREKTILAKQEDGSEEYCKSLNRLTSLEKQLFELEKSEAESENIKIEAEENQKDRLGRTILESIKIGSGIVMPIIGLVWITAVEKDTTFTGALKEYTKYFLPKKK